MEGLLAIDRDLLLLVNGPYGAFPDELMWLISQKWTWIPLYVALLVMLVRVHGWRHALIILGVAGLVILAADQISSGLLKPLIARPRPCHEPFLQPILHVVGGKCGGPYGFASSHAANFMALACFMRGVLPVGGAWRWFKVGLFAAAVLVGVSRIYLGVHYPGDVVVGWVIGALVGLGGAALSKKLLGMAIFPQSSSK